jgi:hypothetical protein
MCDCSHYTICKQNTKLIEIYPFLIHHYHREVSNLLEYLVASIISHSSPNLRSVAKKGIASLKNARQ